MKTHFFCSCLVGVIISGYSFSQEVSSATINPMTESMLGLDKYMNYIRMNDTRDLLKDIPYEDIQGNPFLNEDFSDGRIILKNGKTYQGPVRYDIYADQFEIQTSNGMIYFIKNPMDIDRITVDNHVFVTGKAPGNEEGSYYELLYDGGVRLLLKRKVVFQQPRPAQPYQEPTPAMFVSKPLEYYMEKGQDLNQIETKTDILKVFADKEAEMKSYIKHNKPDFRNADDLINIIKYYLTL
jgi:hypothetical protein